MTGMVSGRKPQSSETYLNIFFGFTETQTSKPTELSTLTEFMFPASLQGTPGGNMTFKVIALVSLLIFALLKAKRGSRRAARSGALL